MNGLYSRIVLLTMCLACMTAMPMAALASGSAWQPDGDAVILQPGLRHSKRPATTLTRFDNNKIINLKLGQKVAIDLAVPSGSDRYDPTAMWSGLNLSTDEFLRPESTPAMFILKPGVTGQTFEAIHPGTTVITARRTIPGTTSEQDWTVTINAIS